MRAIMRHPTHTGGSDAILVGGETASAGVGHVPPLPRRTTSASSACSNSPTASITSPAARARRLRLTDRGLVREGYHADLVLFDPDAVRDTATFDNPRQQADGHPLGPGQRRPRHRRRPPHRRTTRPRGPPYRPREESPMTTLDLLRTDRVLSVVRAPAIYDARDLCAALGCRRHPCGRADLHHARPAPAPRTRRVHRRRDRRGRGRRHRTDRRTRREAGDRRRRAVPGHARPGPRGGGDRGSRSRPPGSRSCSARSPRPR